MNVFITKIKEFLIEKIVVFATIREIRQINRWRKNSYILPAPNPVKIQTLLRHFHGDTVVETGTFTGQTTQVLGKYFKKVITIEAHEKLFRSAEKKFSKATNIQTIFGRSQDIFPQILPTLTGEINFYLDGHNSGQGTFEDEIDTPLIPELNNIRDNFYNFDCVTICIDDVRLFPPDEASGSKYPTLNYLCHFASTNRCEWIIENDIFIIKSQKEKVTEEIIFD